MSEGFLVVGCALSLLACAGLWLAAVARHRKTQHLLHEAIALSAESERALLAALSCLESPHAQWFGRHFDRLHDAREALAAKAAT